MAFPSLFVFFFVFHLFLLVFCGSNCPESFLCNKDIGILKYPFTKLDHPECGLIEIDCGSPSTPKILKFGYALTRYDVMNISISSDELMVRDTMLRDHLNSRDCSSFRSPPLPIYPFISFIISPNLTLFRCEKPFDTKIVEDYFEDYKNYTHCEKVTFYYRNPSDDNPTRETGRPPPSGCYSIRLPWNASVNWSDDLFKLLTFEYTIEWHVSDDEGSNKKKKVALAAAIPGAAFLVPLLACFIIWQYKKRATDSVYMANAKNQVEIELFLKNHGTLAPKMYKYSHLKKITNSFSENLGKGGYGSVYKGKLQDGRLVAVKILSESKGNGEDFINEVSSISRTSHVNIVALLGFCFDGSKRALVYEFMPNGSLEKFIPNTSTSAPNSSLGVEKLSEIIVGIARGLEYLHQGCNMRILHFDIKPHNILLDKDFKPKISDFGLSKLCPNRSSIVSMQGTRGTVGYIAPEVFCRNFGEVSHKSDVYSYGMMVLEMVVGRQNDISPQGELSSEIYFSDWIYKNLEQNTIEKGVVDDNLSQIDEWSFVKRRLITIGLWCIQTDPKNRPSISRVIEMLEAKLESLQLPPRPCLSSSPILPLISSSLDSEPLL